MPAQLSSSSIARKRRPARITAATIAVGTASVFALSACASSGKVGATGGTGAKTPADALAASVTNLSASKSESFELSFQPDAAAIASMNKTAGSGSAAALTSKLLGNGGIDVKIQVSADKPLKDLTATDAPNASVSISLGGKDYFDVITAGGALYLKADVPDALTLAGVPSSMITGELGQLPASIQGPAQAAIAGKWLTVSAADLKSLESLASLAGGGDNAPATSAPSAGQLAQVESALITALTKDTTVVDKGNGQLQVTGKVKTLAQDFLQAAQPLLGNLPGSTKTDLTKAQDGLTQLPDQNVTFDVWISGGQLSELKIDTAQFAKDAGGGHAPLDMKISPNAGSISAPSGATKVDVQGIISGLGAGL
jgi:hypothetical protein